MQAQNIKQLGELLSAATDLGGGGSFVNGGGSMNAKRKVKGSVSLTEESLYEVARQNLATDQAADEESQQIPRSEGTKGTPRLTSDEISHPNAVAGGGSSKKLRSESTKLRSESTSKKLRSEGTKLQSESTKLRSESRRKKKEKPAPEGDDPAPDAEAEPKAEADTLGRQGEVEHLSKKLTASSFKDSGELFAWQRPCSPCRPWGERCARPACCFCFRPFPLARRNRPSSQDETLCLDRTVSDAALCWLPAATQAGALLTARRHHSSGV